MSCRLNHECIRDIMLCMEEKMDYSGNEVSVEEIIEVLKDRYEEDCLDYHCRLIDSAGFIGSSFYADNTGFFSGFTWKGHEYLDNIRDQKAWTIVKDATKDLSSLSLEVIKDLAKEIMMSLGKKGVQKLLGQI